MARITNETLAALMTEQHQQVTRRLDSIDARVAETNGRLRSAESDIAVHRWALGLLGAALVVWLGVWLTKVL